MEISCLELSYFIVKFKKKHFENFIYGNLVFIVVIHSKIKNFIYQFSRLNPCLKNRVYIYVYIQ